MKRLIQWILSKLFPYKVVEMECEEVKIDDNWARKKRDESEYFYGGTHDSGLKKRWTVD